MARYTGSACSTLPTEGIKLYLKGERCYSDKCQLHEGSMLPDSKQKQEEVEYGLQLRKSKSQKIV